MSGAVNSLGILPQRRTFPYDRLVNAALKGVVGGVLEDVAANGLPIGSHFYITFASDHLGVVISDRAKKLGEKGESTIVLQYQFWDLVVSEDCFSVTLSFDGIKERITVPFCSITTFADPSAPFALTFPESRPALSKDA